jgi:hypothetical protein
MFPKRENKEKGEKFLAAGATTIINHNSAKIPTFYSPFI